MCDNMSFAAATLDTGALLGGFLKGIWLLVTNAGFVLLLCAGFFLLYLKSKKNRLKGWAGEAVTRVAGLGRLDAAVYRTYNDLYLPRPDGKGTTQIDHVVVSLFGVFVIETKNFSGWIYGGEDQRNWTQQHFKKKTQIPNPLHQNKLHARALRQFLHIPETALIPIVWMMGDAIFKTPVPKGVLTSGLIKFITSHAVPVLTPGEVIRINEALEQLDRNLDRKTVSRAHNAQWNSGK